MKGDNGTVVAELQSNTSWAAGGSGFDGHRTPRSADSPKTGMEAKARSRERHAWIGGREQGGKVDMNNAIGWFLGLCCGLPLLAALVLGGAAGYGSDPRTFVCLTVTALLGGCVAFRFFTRRDEDDEWGLDELEPGGSSNG